MMGERLKMPLPFGSAFDGFISPEPFFVRKGRVRIKKFPGIRKTPGNRRPFTVGM
jgi:hypothetical protein